jgi:signal transduction histidine kinase/predicted CoA-binding protein
VYEFLRNVPLFAELPDNDLERLCEIIDEVHLDQGQLLFAEGTAGDRAYVIKEGQLEVVKASGEREVLLAVRGVGEVIGEISLVEEAPRMASVRAQSDSVLLAVSQDQFDHLITNSPSAARALLHTVISRWRSTEAMLRQSEKMAQLGTLTAGLAHELNNPAAAVQRGTEQMRLADEGLQQANLQLIQLNLSEDHVDQLRWLGQRVRDQASRPDDLDALSRSDLEEVLEEWLEDQNLEESWDLAPSLVSLGYTPADLATLAESFAPHHLPGVITWLAGSYARDSLLEEIHQGAGRISEIVKSLKSYAYLDQAPVQSVDIHEGLDNTLIMLRNKLKEGIDVRRDYAENLPKILAYGSELNQVWTNLIDNAVDAMGGKGELTLHTFRDGDWVVVQVIDNGAGIPEAIVKRVFDPFFTTKPPGKGTGLGLDITWNIVSNKHKGDIRVTSQPGKTCFEVWLPINFDAIEGPTSVRGITRPADDVLRHILETVETIAVVGISSRSGSPAHDVPAYLQEHGYRILPVNPSRDEILGEVVYAALTDLPGPVDLVQIFRRGDRVPPIVDQAIQIGAKVIWMQEGIVNEAAAAVARAAGLTVVMDTCMRTTHRRLFRGEG